jgi:transposase-like protein
MPVCHKGVYALVSTGEAKVRRKKRKNTSLDSTVLSLTLRSPKRTIDISMVRLFTAFCKSYLKILSDKIIFDEAAGSYSYQGEACPRCGAVGKLTSHGTYTRGLTSRKSLKLIDCRLKPLRFKCESCAVTHALLPDIIIPYGRYSLSFVLSALIAYFDRTTSVVDICGQLGIAVSTLYDWLKRVAAHKDLMLGVLISNKTNTIPFLNDLLGCDNLSDLLRRFFQKHGFSFMQRRSLSTTRSHPP